MKNVSAGKMSKPRPPANGTQTPRVGGHTSNATPKQGVGGGFGGKGA